MKPYYEHAGITIYHGDCREIAPTLGDEFAVVTDPPYGMDWDTDSTRYTAGEERHKRGMGRSDWGEIHGDNEPFDPARWLQYPAAVFWGYHHFAQALPLGSVFVWIKRADHLFGSFLSDCELAWRKGGHGVYAYRKQFPPPSRMAENDGSVAHPTQKPLGLMAWCIARCGSESLPVLDPFMGSGTTLRAAKNLGRKAIGIEIEERHCEIAAKRLSQEVLFPTGESGERFAVKFAAQEKRDGR